MTDQQIRVRFCFVENKLNKILFLFEKINEISHPYNIIDEKYVE
jgi:hypothetical protein